MKLQVGVKVILTDKSGRILLLKRSKSKYPRVSERWDIAGGRIEPGTDLMANLKREVMEETGLSLAGTPKLIAAQDILTEDAHIVRLTFKGKAKNGTIKLHSGEHTAYRWVKQGELASVKKLDKYLAEVLDSGAV